MKRAILVFLLSFTVMSGYSQHSKEIFISTEGSDRARGGERSPLKTIQAAISKASTHDGDVKIIVKEGNYRTDKTIEITQGEWNSLELIGGGKASISGDVELKISDLKPVTDSEVLKRLQPQVREKVRVLDFKSMGLELSDIRSVGFGRPSAEAWSELVVNGEHLKLSRWPNDSMVLTGKIIVSGDAKDKEEGNLPIFQFNEDRPMGWKDDGNIWISGYFGAGYADDMIRVKELNKADSTIHPDDFTIYQFKSGADFHRWFAYNVLEEIDLEGEYVLDSKGGKIYFLPPAEGIESVKLTRLKEPVFAIENCKNVTIKGLTIENSRGIGVYMENNDGAVVDSCTLRNLGSVGLCVGAGTISKDKKSVLPHSMEDGGLLTSRVIGDMSGKIYKNVTLNRRGGKNSGIRNSYIYNTGAGGVSLSGGDRTTLEKGNNFVENCIISSYNRIEKSYRAAVWMDGVGCRVTKCDIFNAPSMAILFHGNDHIIEYCTISDVCTEVDDQGAIYYGRDPAERGHIIRYNYFKDLSPRHRVTATYHDDGACGSEVYGNIYLRAGSMPVLIGGGMDHDYHGNIFIDSPVAIHIDKRLTNWAQNMVAKGGIYEERLDKVNYNKPPYSEAYPNLPKYWEDDPANPKRNYFHGNLFVNIKNLLTCPTSFGEFWNNWITNEDPGFVDINDPLKGFKPDAIVFERIEGFEDIDFQNIGSSLDRLF